MTGRLGTGSGSLAGRAVLVTGATGFLGTHLVRALTAVGAEVHALRRRPDAGTRLPCEGVKWHLGDVLDLASLREVVRKARPEKVFHLAAHGTVEGGDPDLTFRVNVEGSLNLWRALDGAGCRFVHAGSCGEYGRAEGQVTEREVCRPTWFYPATKNASVVLLSTLGRESGREVVTLRPFGPYGPADDPRRVVPHVVLSLLRGEDVAVTEGEQLRDYAFVEDQVEAFLLAATRPLASPGEIYNVGSGEVTTLRRLMESVAEAVGDGALRRIRFGALPYRESEMWEMCANIDAARRDLGYVPRTPLAEGLRRTVAWYRERLGKA